MFILGKLWNITQQRTELKTLKKLEFKAELESREAVFWF